MALYLKKDGWISEEAHTGRRACEDHVTWTQREEP